MIFLAALLLLVPGAHPQPQDGICFVNYTTRSPLLEPYTYTKRVQRHEKCGYRYCLKEHVVLVNEHRYVYRDVVHQRPECCSGYEKIVSQTSKHGFDCNPVCDPLCVFGHCSSPGNCTCNDGYVHITSNVCSPACTTPCEFGNCTAPNTCTCYEGYTKHTDSICKPVCTPSCVNGDCIKPDVCECNPGFKFHSTNRSICEPHCEGGCANSKCVKPNECVCFEGYEMLLNQTNACKPSCSLECINGDCSAPETCTCKEGYHLENSSWNNCVPDCNCTNGYCHEPNKCICIQNFTLNEEGSCEPICGDCVNSTCTSPYLCECLEGYAQYNRTVCVPYCSNCEHGTCTDPEECSCFEGYESDGSTCEPVCSAGCANGLCIAPDRCTCDSDHDEVLENVCLPLCDANCTDCNETKAECFFALRANVSNSFHLHQYSMKISIPINYNYLQNLSNTSCPMSDCQRNNCSGITIDCFAIKSVNKNNFLCMLKTNDSYLEGVFEETILNNEFTEDISAIYNKEVDLTILFPRPLQDAKGECELCSCSSEIRHTEGNKIVFQMAPCPTGFNERVDSPMKSEDSMLLYIMIGVIAISLLSLAILATVFFKKGRFHEYVVNRNDHRKLEAYEDETEMLHPDACG